MSAIRLQRGFRRIGIVVAIPLLIITVAFGSMAGIAAYRSQISKAQLLAKLPPVPPGFVLGRSSPGAVQEEWEALSDEANEKAFIAAASAAAAALAFLFFWALGWIAAGFARE